MINIYHAVSANRYYLTTTKGSEVGYITQKPSTDKWVLELIHVYDLPEYLTMEELEEVVSILKGLNK